MRFEIVILRPQTISWHLWRTFLDRVVVINPSDFSLVLGFELTLHDRLPRDMPKSQPSGPVNIVCLEIGLLQM